MTDIFCGFSKIGMLILFLVAILLSTITVWGFSVADGIKTEMVNDWIIAVGSSLFIIMSLSWVGLSRVLNNKVMRFMGRISYSLYLWHVVILYTSNALVNVDVLIDLVEQSKLFHYTNNYFYLFAKRGFTEQCVIQAENMRNVKLICFEDM